MKIAQDIDVDGKTVVVEGQKLQSNLVFSERELIVPGEAIQQLIFRQPTNSNAIMMCTGFQHNNEWYGDRPDDGVFQDPFAGKTYKRENGVVTEFTPPVRAQFIVEETWGGLVLWLKNTGRTPDTLPAFTNFNYNGSTIGDITWTQEDANTLVSRLSFTGVSYTDPVSVSLTLDGTVHNLSMPKVADNGGPATFMIEANSFTELFPSNHE